MISFWSWQGLLRTTKGTDRIYVHFGSKVNANEAKNALSGTSPAHSLIVSQFYCIFLGSGRGIIKNTDKKDEFINLENLLIVTWNITNHQPPYMLLFYFISLDLWKIRSQIILDYPEVLFSRRYGSVLRVKLHSNKAKPFATQVPISPCSPVFQQPLGKGILHQISNIH